MRAVVLAAGEGTRLRPLTDSCPKPMLPVAGKPVIEHIIRWLGSYGFDDIAINVHYKPDVIQSYFGDGRRFQVQLSYSVETAILGTAGALRALGGFLDSTFAVIYGDVLTDLDLGALLAWHRKKEAIATVSLYQVPNPTECGIVALNSDGRVVRLVEKPPAGEVFSDLAFSGILIAEPELLAAIPDTPFSDLGYHVFPRLLETRESVYGLPISPDEYLIDIGSHDKYAAACRDWPSRVLEKSGVSAC